MIRGSLRLLTVAGIGIYVHWTFFLLVAFVAYSRMKDGREAVVTSVALLLALFACVTLHELGHALTAKRFGIKTEDITLLPIGGVARLQRMPENPVQELLVALAGPAVNVVIAAILYPLLDKLPDWGAPLIGGADFFASLMIVNVFLVAFNMLPAFPMDGGRVLRAVMAMFMDRVKATRIAAAIGQMMALFFAAWAIGLLQGIGLGPNLMLLIIAFFVYIGAAGEAQAVETAELFRNVRVRDAMVTRFRTLSPEQDLPAATAELLTGSQHDFPVVEDGRVIGLLSRTDLIRALSQPSDGLTVRHVMQPDCMAVNDAAPLNDALQAMREKNCSDAPVLSDGRLVGLLTAENVNEFLMVRAAMHHRPHPLPA